MRLLFFVLLFVFQIGSSSVHAQESDEKEMSIYARATDEQLAEAQKYYKLCSSNPTLSAEKDCKCAAAKYLETRLELGDTASQSDILNKNIDSCRKAGDETPLPKGTTDYSKVPKAYLEEASSVYKECSKNARVSLNVDCQCFAAEFLTKRIENGKRISRDSIITSLRSSCRNIVGTTGREYSSCMHGDMDMGFLDGVTQKEYCECVANEWARQYKNFKGDIDNPLAQNEMGFSARMKCRNASMYKN